MKIYLHMNLESFSNCYFVVNELSKEALIIDPGKINGRMINQLEDGGLTLRAVLITHHHKGHTMGLLTLGKIYNVNVFAADSGVASSSGCVIKGDGTLALAGMIVSYYSIPGHSSDSMVFKIGNVIFTGDTLQAGIIGSTNNIYAKKTLRNGIRSKLLIMSNDTVIMPGHGPLSTIGVEKVFNLDLK